jgi:hypothetical protein
MLSAITVMTCSQTKRQLVSVDQHHVHAADYSTHPRFTQDGRERSARSHNMKDTSQK